jgi:heat-inducible transcriptional repressor
MLDERKAAILRAVVEEYIDTAQPVGSGHVATAPGVDVSSATVRNEMATLEADGYLRQPHTSAGRVPTEKGYRFFVDHLRQPRLQGRSAEEVRDFFARAHGEVEQMLAQTSRLLSNLTNLTSVVVSPVASEAMLRSVQLVALSPSAGLVVAVFSDGTVEKHTIELPAGARDERVSAAGAHLAAYLSGTARHAAPRVPPTGDAPTDALVTRAIEALTGGPVEDPEHVYVGGAARMAQAFDAIETVREVLGILEQQFVVVSLLRDVIDRGVLGPTRMNYPQALAAVAVVSNRLSDRLTEG